MKKQLSTLLAIQLVVVMLASSAMADCYCGTESICQSCSNCQTVDCENIDNSMLGRIRASWANRSQKMRRWLYRLDQRQKNLKHPECPPFMKPAWGYHETCWRKFPPTCPCPPANYEMEVQPALASPTTQMAPDEGWRSTRISQKENGAIAQSEPESLWQPVAATVNVAAKQEKVWQLSDPHETLHALDNQEKRTFLLPLVQTEH